MNTTNPKIIERPISPNYFTQILAPTSNNCDSKNITIKSIVKSKKYTRIDLQIYPDTLKYNSNWWCNIIKTVHLRAHNSNSICKLISAVNIPYSPQRYYFPNNRSCLNCTLYFEPLPNSVSFIDFIESEQGSDSFNFYGISVNFIKHHSLNIY